MTTLRKEEEDAGPVPLSSNRNYNILWVGQLFSQLVVEIVGVVLPLLVLARSGSPLEVGLASAALAAAQMAAVVPAGVIADRWDRRRTLITCAAVRTAGMLSLAVALAVDRYSFWHVLAVVVAEGVFVAVFDPAEHAALPQVVPASQLSVAVARNTARPYVASVLGPPAAGFLFSLHPVHPFLANGVMLALSCAAFVLLRLPRRTVPAAPPDPPDAPAQRPRSTRGDLVAVFRWVRGQRVVRATLVWVMFTNLVFSALVIVVLVMAGEDKVGAGETGLMMGCFGAGGVLGALVAARLHATVPARLIVLGFSWLAAAGTAAMALVPTGVPLGVLLGVLAFLAPAANTTVLTYQLLVTPDELRGRVSGLAGFCGGGAGALGPLLGGTLLAAGGGGVRPVLGCALAFGLIALFVTANPVLRRFPSHDPLNTTSDS